MAGKRRRYSWGSVNRIRTGWRLRYPCPEHAPARTESGGVYPTRDEAERILGQLRAVRDRGESVCSARAVEDAADEHAERYTLAYWVQRWRGDGGSRGTGHTGKTSYTNDGMLRRHVLPRWGDRDVRTIRRGELQAWVRELSRSGRLDGGGLSPTQVHQAFRLVSGPLRHALSEDVVEADVCVGVKLPPKPPGRRPGDPEARIPPDLVDRLAAAMPARLAMVPLLAYYAQLRSGEIVALRRRNVGLAGRTLTVAESASAGGGVRFWSDTKTHDAGQATLALPASVARQLTEHLAEHVGEHPDSLLFAATRDPGQPVSEGDLRYWWDKACRAAEVERTPHDVKAAGESLVADATDTLVAARRARHSPTVALRHYQTTDPEESRRVADKLDTLREQGRDQEPAEPDSL